MHNNCRHQSWKKNIHDNKQWKNNIIYHDNRIWYLRQWGGCTKRKPRKESQVVITQQPLWPDILCAPRTDRKQNKKNFSNMKVFENPLLFLRTDTGKEAAMIDCLQIIPKPGRNDLRNRATVTWQRSYTWLNQDQRLCISKPDTISQKLII